MKRFKLRITGAITFFLLFMAGVVNISISFTADHYAEFTLTNIEALAEGENGGGSSCGGYGLVTCDDGSSYEWKYTR